MKTKFNAKPYFIVMFSGLVIQFLVGLWGFNSSINIGVLGCIV